MGKPQDWLWSFKEQDLSIFVVVARFSIFLYFRHHGISIGQYKVLDVQKGIGKLLLVSTTTTSRVPRLLSHMEFKRTTKNSTLSSGDDFTSSRPPPISKCQIVFASPSLWDCCIWRSKLDLKLGIWNIQIFLPDMVNGMHHFLLVINTPWMMDF